MTIEEMIEKLIDDDILTIKSAMYHNDYEYLYNILGDGMGYNSWTDKQIEIEYNDRTWEEA
jgi:hypothetical protein